MIQVVFETHSWSEDNEQGVASGWNHSRLSPRGRALARELGQRRADGLAAVFSSDLRRAAETAEIAFSGTATPVLLDWRLRECDFGEGNGKPAMAPGAGGGRFLDDPHLGGESWRQAIRRVGCFLGDLPLRWDEKSVLVIGHLATWRAMEHYLDGVPIEELVGAHFAWQEGWEYLLDPEEASAWR